MPQGGSTFGTSDEIGTKAILYRLWVPSSITLVHVDPHGAMRWPDYVRPAWA